MFYHINTPKYNPQQCTYTNSFFILPYEHNMRNNVGLGVYSPNNDLRIEGKFLRLPNILCLKLYALLIALTAIINQLQNKYIFTDNLNIIYLISNHIHHP